MGEGAGDGCQAGGRLVQVQRLNGPGTRPCSRSLGGWGARSGQGQGQAQKRQWQWQRQWQRQWQWQRQGQRQRRRSHLAVHVLHGDLEAVEGARLGDLHLCVGDGKAGGQI